MVLYRRSRRWRCCRLCCHSRFGRRARRRCSRRPGRPRPRFRPRSTRSAPLWATQQRQTRRVARQSGRREINWDGGGASTTTAPVTPFNVFLNTRGAQFTTPGTGLVAGAARRASAADLFDNPNYATSSRTFSPLRLFTPVGSNGSPKYCSSCPARTAATAATVTGFGAVFTDVDQPDGSEPTEAPQGQHSDRVLRRRRQAALQQLVPLRRATGAFPSSASSSTTRGSPGCGSRPATPRPGPDDDRDTTSS